MHSTEPMIPPPHPTEPVDPHRAADPPRTLELAWRTVNAEPARLERLVEHLIRGGVHGIFALGTTGEAPSLSHRLRRDLVEQTLRLTSGRVPVLVGITDTSFTESLELARVAAEAGAAAVVTAPPYYFPAGQPELCEYLDDLAGSTPTSWRSSIRPANGRRRGRNRSGSGRRRRA